VLDLVRLATSALLARRSRGVGGICAAILEGYGKGLSDPRPFVLDDDHAWLRELVAATDQDRAQFWRKIDKLKRSNKGGPPDRYRRAIATAMPDRGIEIKFRPRTAGTGSLGRPQWVGIADWRGGRVVRGAKALVMSGWARQSGSQSQRCKEIALGRYRAPDRWYDVVDETVVRRLSPNSRKIEVKNEPDELLDSRLLRAMGHELANIHLGTGNRRAAIDRDLSERKGGWLRAAAAAAAEFVVAEHKEWTKA